MALESLPKIAPALFSAEQDLIQIYNKKSDTVGTINASLIGTPPSGVSGAIQFSTGSAFGSDSTNLFWDDINKRLGVRTNAPISTMHIAGLSTFIGASGSTLGSTTAGAAAQFYQNGFSALLAIGGFANNGAELQTYTNGGITLGGTNIYLQRQSGNVLIGGTTGAGKLTVQGSGSTSATTSLLVQNGSGTEAFRVRDDNVILVNGGSIVGVGTVHSNAVATGYINSAGNAFTVMQTNNSTGSARFYQSVMVGSSSEPTNTFEIASTSASPFKAATTQSYFRSTYQNSGASGIFDLVSNYFSFPSNDVVFGSSSSLSARVGIKGSGSTQATTSLLVQNSGGTETFKVQDDGNVVVPVKLSAANNKFEVTSSGNQVIIKNPAIGNHFFIGPSNICGVDSYFTAPTLTGGSLTITTASGSFRGSTMALSNFLASNTGTNYGLQINSQYSNMGAGGPNYGKQVRFYDNLVNSAIQMDMTFAYVNPIINYTSTGNGQIVGFDFDPVVTSVTANTKVRAFQSSVGGAYINTTTYQASAILQADSTTQGFLPPRMTDAQIRAIASPVNGLIAYNTTIDHLCCYQGGAWVKFNHSPM
jgi:hypothetical protein